nr:MAG TPA: hypothetical protein [Caudoviricetes sp.]
MFGVQHVKYRKIKNNENSFRLRRRRFLLWDAYCAIESSE